MKIQIDKLLLDVNLGVPTSERQKLQTIELEVIIDYGNNQNSISEARDMGNFIHDRCGQVFCYDEICSRIRNFVKERSWELLEVLSYDLHQFLSALLCGVMISLKVRKRPAITGLEGGIICIIDE